MRNKDKPWFYDQCRHAFGLIFVGLIFVGHVISLELTGKSLSDVK